MVNSSVSVMELIVVALLVVAVIKASLAKSRRTSFSSARAVLKRRLSKKRVLPACSMWVVADDIRATLPAPNCPILGSKLAAVSVEEQKKERKLSWCFLMAEVNPNEEVAIADSVE